jgi:phosphonate transport system substrate-binding protein
MSLRRFATVFTLALSLAVTAFAAPPTVRLGLSSKNAEETQKNFGTLMKYLASATDVKYEVSTYPTYEALYDAFKQQKVDIALVGAVKYVEAHHELGAIPIISEGGMIRSVIVVPKNSPLKTAAELKGKRFAFGYKDSTSTHLFPLLLLSKNHIKEADLGSAQFIGPDQQKLVEALLTGKADATAIVESVYKQHKEKLRVLEASAPFPGGPLMARKNTDPKVVEAVRRTFLAFKDATGPRFISGSIAVKDSDFNQVRFLCKVLYGKTYV